MTILYWVLWFVITTDDGLRRHFPVETEYPTQAACEADMRDWITTLVAQFPKDKGLQVYCEPFPPTRKEPL
jgi:hypothetical protein